MNKSNLINNNNCTLSIINKVPKNKVEITGHLEQISIIINRLKEYNKVDKEVEKELNKLHNIYEGELIKTKKL